jgi:phosphoglycolate phosphatase
VFAFLFDLDGTLIDSRRSIAAACNHALVRMRRAELADAEIVTYVGNGARHLVARALRAEASSELTEEALGHFVEYYAAHPIDGTEWMPGAREALDLLAGRRIGLVTNKTRAITVPILRALGIESRFDVVIAGGDAPLKPDPAPIALAMSRVGSTAARTWLVGDGVQDVRAGKSAGCRTAAVLGGFHSEERLRAESPDKLLRSLTEISALLEAG